MDPSQPPSFEVPENEAVLSIALIAGQPISLTTATYTQGKNGTHDLVGFSYQRALVFHSVATCGSAPFRNRAQLDVQARILRRVASWQLRSLLPRTCGSSRSNLAMAA